MVKHIISGFFARAMVAVINLIILITATSHLGSELWGQISLLILNITVVHCINEIYTGAALVHYIPRTALGKLYTTGLLWTLAGTLLINLVFLVLSVGMGQLWVHVMALSFLVTLNGFHNVVLLGREKLAMYNFMVLLQPALLLLALILTLFVFGKHSIEAYLWPMYASFVFPILVSGISILKLTAQLKTDHNAFDAKTVLKNGFINQLGNLAHTLSNRFNYYMIGSAALIGIYASATSLIESLWIISGSVSPVILTRVANQRDPAGNVRLTLVLSKISFLLSVFAAVILLFLPTDFFTYFLGKDFSETKTVMLYLLPGVLCISFSNIISHYFSGQGKQNILLRANTAGLLVTLCTSYFFIQSYGLKGACFAASMSYFAQASVLTVVFLSSNKLNLKNLFSTSDFRLLKK